IESIVARAVKEMLGSPPQLLAALGLTGSATSAIRAIALGKTAAASLDDPGKAYPLLRNLVSHVHVAEASVSVAVLVATLAKQVGVNLVTNATYTVALPIRLATRGVQAKL